VRRAHSTCWRASREDEPLRNARQNTKRTDFVPITTAKRTARGGEGGREAHRCSQNHATRRREQDPNDTRGHIPGTAQHIKLCERTHDDPRGRVHGGARAPVLDASSEVLAALNNELQRRHAHQGREHDYRQGLQPRPSQQSRHTKELCMRCNGAAEGCPQRHRCSMGPSPPTSRA
jgi:hypothetical protein